MANEEFRKRFSANLKSWMDVRGKTQADLAKHLNISEAAVSYWLNGTKIPRMDKVDAICSFLLINRDELLAGPSGEDDVDENYYLNDDSRELVQFLFDNPDYKVLFDASRKVKVEDIAKVKQMIDLMCGDE